MQAVVGVRLLFMGEHSDRIRDASSNVEQKVRHDRNRSWQRVRAVFCDLRSPEQLSLQRPTIPVVDLFAGQRDGRSFCTTETETRKAHLLWTTSQESLHMVDRLDILVCARYLHTP